MNSFLLLILNINEESLNCKVTFYRDPSVLDLNPCYQIRHQMNWYLGSLGLPNYCSILFYSSLLISITIIFSCGLMIYACLTLIGYGWTARKFRCSFLMYCRLLPLLETQDMDASAQSLNSFQQVNTVIGLVETWFQRRAIGSKKRFLLWFQPLHYSVYEQIITSMSFQKCFCWYQGLFWND